MKFLAAVGAGFLIGVMCGLIAIAAVVIFNL